MFLWVFGMKYLEFEVINQGEVAMLHDVGLLALRLTLAAVFLGHGAQKAFGAFGGAGFTAASGFLGRLGLRPARFWAGVAVTGELPAGLLLLVRSLRPVGC